MRKTLVFKPQSAHLFLCLLAYNLTTSGLIRSSGNNSQALCKHRFITGSGSQHWILCVLCCAVQGGARGYGGQGSLSAGSTSVDSQQQLLAAQRQSVATLVPQGGYKPGGDGYTSLGGEQLEPGAIVDANTGLAYYANPASGGYGGGLGGVGVGGGAFAPVSPTTNNTDYAPVRRLSMGAPAFSSSSMAVNVGANGLPPNASLAARRNASRPDLSSMQFNNFDGQMQQPQSYNTLQYNRPTTYRAGGGMGYSRQQSGGGSMRPSNSMQWGPSAQVNTSGLDPGNYAMRTSQGNLGGRFGASQPSTPFGTMRRTRYEYVLICLRILLVPIVHRICVSTH